MRTSYSVLGACKMHMMWGRYEAAQRHGAGHVVRCTARATHGRTGAARSQRRSKSPRTICSAHENPCPADLTGLAHHLRPRRAVQVHPLRGRPVQLRGGSPWWGDGGLLPGVLWPRSSTRCRRPSWSATRGPGGTSVPSSSSPPSGSTGRVPSGRTQLSACVASTSPKSPGSPTSARTAKNDHNQQSRR